MSGRGRVYRVRPGGDAPLRYRSADHMVVTAMSCACGRTSPRVRCVGRTDGMLIYRAMNVFPSAIRDVVMRGFQDAVEPYLRIWKDRPDQVRYDAPTPVDVEASPGLATGRYDEVARAIERELRGGGRCEDEGGSGGGDGRFSRLAFDDSPKRRETSARRFGRADAGDGARPPAGC